MLSLISIPSPETVIKHQTQQKAKRGTHATVQLHYKVSSIYHQGLHHRSSTKITRATKFSQFYPAEVELSWAMHSHRSFRSQPCDQLARKALRPHMAAITISFPIIKKSIRHNSPDAGDNTKQSFMGPSAGFLTRVQRRLDRVGHIWLQCIC